MPINQNLDEDNSLAENLNRNLSNLMEINKISLTALHRNTGIAIPTIKRLQTDRTANPTMTTLLPIANFFNLTVNQLFEKNLIINEFHGFIENKKHWLQVPVIDWENITTFVENKNSFKKESFILVDIDVGNHPYALIVEEEDWLNISKGSILIINSDIEPENKDFVITYKDGHLPTLKKIMIDEEKMYLKSLNPFLPATLYDANCTFLGVLIQIRKNIKNI